MRQRFGRSPFDVDLALENHRIALLEKFVRVARVAIDATELTSAVGVDRPAKRQSRIIASIQNLLDRHLDELDVAQPGRLVLRGQKRQFLHSSHGSSFAVSSLY